MRVLPLLDAVAGERVGECSMLWILTWWHGSLGEDLQVIPLPKGQLRQRIDSKTNFPTS